MSGRHCRHCSLGRIWRNTMKKQLLKPNIIIGIICLIAGIILSVIRLEFASVTLALAGLAILIKGSDKHFSALRAFRPKTFGFVVIFDAVFWLITVGAAWLMGQYLNTRTAGIQQELESLAAAGALEQALSGFYIVLVVLFVIYLLIELIAYTVFRGFIWLSILNKKPKKFFLRFLGLNAVWWLIWLLPSIFILGGLKQEFTAIAAPILLVLYLHLTTIVHYVYVSKRSIKKAISAAFTVGFGRIHRFIVPYAFLFLGYFILLNLYLFVPRQGLQSYIATMSFVIIYLAWFRLFMAETLKELKV